MASVLSWLGPISNGSYVPSKIVEELQGMGHVDARGSLTATGEATLASMRAKQSPRAIAEYLCIVCNKRYPANSLHVCSEQDRLVDPPVIGGPDWKPQIDLRPGATVQVQQDPPPDGFEWKPCPHCEGAGRILTKMDEFDRMAREMTPDQIAELLRKMRHG